MSETAQISDTLARYRAWADHRSALSVEEGATYGQVAADDWHASDDEAAELAHHLAGLLAATRPGAVPDTGKKG
ncbi:MAG: hypothetical protein L0H26_00125 [Microlunatus sp.]|nr:hypothetical protein [Microlunatus sp.]